jgi:hypothetical protein
MGIRGELYSTRVGCEGRTYFFNVKENRMGDMFLTVVESKPNESEGFERRSVVVFREDLPNFLKAFQGALDFMSGGEGAAGTAKYEPSAGAAVAAARKPRAPGGFAGSVNPSAGSGDPEVSGGGKTPAEGARRKKIVVKRKSSAPKPDAEG